MGVVSKLEPVVGRMARVVSCPDIPRMVGRTGKIIHTSAPAPQGQYIMLQFGMLTESTAMFLPEELDVLP